MTRLSSLFLLGVAGEDGKPVRIGERFWIRNGDSYDGGNPYAFTLPDYTVSVLDFGARGDGFTNDTPAIQQAIDHVSAKGGGVVVVPGRFLLRKTLCGNKHRGLRTTSSFALKRERLSAIPPSGGLCL